MRLMGSGLGHSNKEKRKRGRWKRQKGKTKEKDQALSESLPMPFSRTPFVYRKSSLEATVQTEPLTGSRRLGHYRVFSQHSSLLVSSPVVTRLPGTGRNLCAITLIV